MEQLDVEAGAELPLAPVAADVRWASFDVTAGGTLSLPAHQLHAAVRPLTFAEFVGLPKYPGSGTFVRVSPTGVFVHNGLTGEFERQSMTGNFERRE